ncbi:MAG: hypothetical protein ACREKS_13595 [Candidatus Rokuibacteriota bacterium]
MANQIVGELRAKSDAAFGNLTRQLRGMEPHMERADAPGQWTTRQVLSHLLFEPGWKPVDTLKTFAHTNLPVIEVTSLSDTSGARATMALGQFVDALDEQRRAVFGYLDTLSDADLGRKARIPIFKEIMGTDEIPITTFVGALFDHHWNDHGGQIVKIRTTAGLPPAE